MTQGNGFLGDRDTLPPECGPECHQAARIDRLFEWLEQRARTEDKRHADLFAGLMKLSADVRTVQDQIVRLSVAQTELATAEATAQHRALRLPPESVPPPARIPRWAWGALAGLGSALGTAWAAYEAATK